ncbi:hypothetical protein C3747_344g35 [Trypanosoma cruzi]|uniref:Exocyst complex component EXOC2/Sec5 N-terminal domain-containing protein n=2 Tax=Trypanosoma cruzi TaxID=5693 RepID=Q4DUX4_TRYCC|nr:hypothetical protein, conserved [Trypanosoma cruzi]EAN96312.1 hypothetical protein, conserved [Trypanosoma cruzi]PWU91192.1 hypothetical protein C3747_344g35 [Trypanosoma cruzi]RNC58510.1 hypothetical protein TcCL_ESM03872 [Trypanosoma cruzi]|eukprot:XP_818163.1 hypothetical protein [Trypanosoma cruzi strain CL Brener]
MAERAPDTEAALQLDPTSRTFDPKAYIRQAHVHATHVDIENTLLQTVGREVDFTEEALKELIRDNIGTFVGCKEAMDVMYANDTLLFTGEAIDPIADAFQTTLEAGEALVAPTVGLFEELRSCRLTKEMLEKLMVVWNVPGVIYEYCGARVPQRRSDVQPSQRGPHRRKKESDAGKSEDGSDAHSSSGGRVEDRTSNVVRERGDITFSASGDVVMPRSVRGALEEFADSAEADGNYILRPGEELIYWHGTPLARCPCSPQLPRSDNAAGGRSNYEAAVLSLRRAMIYLEENYDLENATVLGVEARDDAEEETEGVHSALKVQKKKQQQQQGGLTLTYQYALSLLRAALYLNEMMAQEIRHASAADTVLIEDTLSSMMDCAIAAVKLRHFCFTASNKLQLNATEAAALLGLRQELQDDKSNKEEDEEDVGESSVMTPTFGSFSATESNFSAEAVKVPPSSLSTEPSTRGHGSEHQRKGNSKGSLLHPVEYYVHITRDQHTRMMENTALNISCEANEWQIKFMPSATAEENSSVRDNRNEPRRMWFGSFAATGDLFGNANDSFVQHNNAGFHPLDSLAFAEGSVTDRIKVGGFGVDEAKSNEQQHADAILEAFRTPEGNFSRFTTFSIGQVEMSGVLECSAQQIAMCSASLLHQIMNCADIPIDISANAAAVDTFFGRLFAACMNHLELVVVSYWGGIAAAVHAGMFDFSLDPRSALYRMIHGPAVLGSNDEGEAASATAAKQSDASVNRNRHADDLPHLTYIPIVREGSPTLRQLSVALVRRGVKAAGEILYALFLSSVNRTLLRGFVRVMAAYRVSDAMAKNREDEEEHIELHAAILVEVILAQWEKAMTHVSDSVWRMKIVIGESCTSVTVASEEQAHEVGGLLEDLEQLRSSVFRCYTHGVGMLAKAYVTLLPSLRQTKPKLNVNKTVSARLSREFVSSVLVNKLLNLLSVVIDRTAPFLQRFDEVYEGIDLFAAKAERDTEDDANQQHGHSTRVLRRKNKEDLEASAQLDTVTAFMAHRNSKMVLEHVEEQEEVLLALVTNIMLLFVDALHQSCQRTSLSTSAAPETREVVHIDSLADALCLPTAVVPIVIGELVSPCILQVVASLKPDAKTSQEVEALLSRKEEHFRVDFISQVEDHCQLVVDAMLSMLLVTPQQRITREVRAPGFMMPMMDWQRVSVHTAGAVRPYIADSILLIVQAHEELQYLRQPLLAAAVTQRLVAHFALTFVTALTSDGNAFEVSLDCSANFLTHGILLMEAEARTILGVADTLADSVVRSSGVSAVIAELNVARELLRGTVTALQRQGNTVCEALAARKTQFQDNDSHGGGISGAGGGGETMTVQQREARCEEMVQSAMRRLRSVVQAIVTHVDDAKITAAFKPVVGSVTENVAERLAKRREGHRVAHAGRSQAEEKKVKVVNPVKDATAEAGIDREKGETTTAAAAPARPRQLTRRKTRQVTIKDKVESDVPMTPRGVEHASVLQRAAEQEERCLIALTEMRSSKGLELKDAADDSQPRVDAGAMERSVRRRRVTGDEKAIEPSATAVRGSRGSHGKRFKRTLAL